MVNWLLRLAAATTALMATVTAACAGEFRPVHQFEIVRLWEGRLFGVDAAFTNSSLSMIVACAVVLGFLIYSIRDHALVPSRMQSIGELTYGFVANMIRDNAGEAGMRFFPVIFTLFMFVLSMNIFGMIPVSLEQENGHTNVVPGGFTVTSHIVVTFALAAFVFIGVTVIGLIKNGFGFFKLFVPSGVPIWLLPLIVVIEVISYFTRPISLSVRLFANMMAGHTMLAVFGFFVVGLSLVGGWLPLIFMTGIMGLEILVAFLQAYVFAVLSCIYLNDALHASDH